MDRASIARQLFAPSAGEQTGVSGLLSASACSEDTHLVIRVLLAEVDVKVWFRIWVVIFGSEIYHNAVQKEVIELDWCREHALSIEIL